MPYGFLIYLMYGKFGWLKGILDFYKSRTREILQWCKSTTRTILEFIVSDFLYLIGDWIILEFYFYIGISS